MQKNPLHIYYLATPVFFLLDYLLGINLRVSIPGGSEFWLNGYYVVCFFAAFIVFKHELTGALFSLMECSINILLLFLSVMVPVFNLGQDPLESSGFKFGVQEMIHFFIAGSVLLYSFYTNPLMLNRQ